MSEDSSSDDDWRVSKKRKCWECGKKFSSIKSLMLHYKSHNIKASCHICMVTFRRLTSLSTHLDNAHSPPFCKKCRHSFSNVWELNKHAETHCTGPAPFQEAPSLITTVEYQGQSSDGFPRRETAEPIPNSKPRPQGIEMKPETAENSVEYIVGEDDMESDCEEEDDSTSSESDDAPGDFDPDDTESDGSSNSSSTDGSRDPSYNPHYENKPAVYTSPNSSTCALCGRGPFRYIKRHLLHCSSARVKYQCKLCKQLFLTEKSLNEHYMPLYTCDVCGQIFSNENSYKHHQCPKGSKSPLVLFCSNSMPQACKVCKSFFTSEKTLLHHVTKVHTSVVSTKVCIITDPSALTDEKVPPGVRGTAARSAISGPYVDKRGQAVNGKPRVGFSSNSGSLSTVVKSSPSSAAAAVSSNPGQSPVPMYLVSADALVKPGEGGTTGGGPTKRPLSCPSPAATELSDPVAPPVPTIMAMFENASHSLALVKRMSTGWRSKAPYPCRQCGAILRQSSLVISHRYLHRGPRSHHCHCGRAFKHRLHLLRHCVQHAETIAYICVSCGRTFTGAKLLAEHMAGKSRRKSRPGNKCRGGVKRQCKAVPFMCDCGQLFVRPSAYIWHQLRNRANWRQSKKPLK